MSVGVYKISLITDSLLQEILKQLETSRKFVVAIKNYSSLTLEKPKVYCASGICQFEFPTTPVPNSKGLVWGARKTDYSTMGTSGVIVYHIKDYKLSLAFMWSIPFNYLFYSNWWNIKVYEGLIEPDEDFFMKMYYDSPHQGDDNSYSGKLRGGWTYDGTMGSAGQSVIKISIYNNKF